MIPVSPDSPANLPQSPASPEPERPSGGAVSVGIVLVSHSRALAEAALDLARRLIVAVDVPVETAAGLADGGLGTDPGAVARPWSSSPSAARASWFWPTWAAGS